MKVPKYIACTCLTGTGSKATTSSHGLNERLTGFSSYLVFIEFLADFKFDIQIIRAFESLVRKSEIYCKRFSEKFKRTSNTVAQRD